MYTQFFKLNDAPFKQSPRASIFHPHSGIDGPYKAILHGVQNDINVMLLTGATGTGKTLCAQRLVADLENTPRFACITLPFSSLSFDDVLDIICSGLNLRFGLGQNEDKMDIIEMFLIHGNSPIKNIVLIIDEAQNLGSDTLTKLLSLCELAKQSARRIQIVALARSEGDLHLNLPEMADFSRSINIRESISPIPPRELHDYISYRLRAAGASYSDVFTESAIDRIFANTQGRPRAVNLLCDQTMDVAAAEKEAIITTEHVDRAQRDQHFDDTIEMRTSMISDAIARYANQPDDLFKGDDDGEPLEEPNNVIKPRKPLFDLPNELNDEPQDKHQDNKSVVVNDTAKMHAEKEPDIETSNKTVADVDADQPPIFSHHMPEPDTLPHFRAEDTVDYDQIGTQHTSHDLILSAPHHSSPSERSGNKGNWWGWCLILIATAGLSVFVFQLLKDQRATIQQLETRLGTTKTPPLTTSDNADLNIDSQEAPPANSIATQDQTPTTYLPEEAQSSNREIPSVSTQPDLIGDQTPVNTANPADNNLPATDRPIPIAKTYPIGSETPQSKDTQDTNANRDPANDTTTRQLELAEYQISLLNLTEPTGNNALETYRTILEKDPDQTDALAGLMRIKDMFLRWAVNNERSDKLNRALRYYQKALLIDPQDTTLPETIARLEAQQSQPRDNNTLSDLLRQARQGNNEIVSTLLETGIDVDQRDNKGNTALMLAAERGQAETVKLLLLHGASVNLTNHVGDTALMNAAWNGHTEIANTLLAANADVNHANTRGWTATLYTAIHGHLDLFKLLQKNGADPQARTVDGKTALAAAAHNGKREMVSVLLAAGADINQADADDWTPLMHAVSNNQTTVVQLLILNRANLNARNQDGWTALMLAAAAGHDRIIDMLIEHKADTQLKNNAGQTAYDLAIEQAHAESASLLR